MAGRKGQPRLLSRRIRLRPGPAGRGAGGSDGEDPLAGPRTSRLSSTSSRARAASAGDTNGPLGSPLGPPQVGPISGLAGWPVAGPTAARARSRRSKLASSRWRGIAPELMAATRASMAASASAGIRIRSAPALKASRAASPGPWWAVIASITRASVTTSPSKPRSRRSRPSSTAGARVAGRAPSRASSSRWAVITLATPAAIAARKGGNSTASSRSRLWRSSGSSRWESLAVSPWPGKCLAQQSTPSAWAPRRKAAARREAVAGSSPQARTLITGLAGLLLTSQTGPSTQFRPSSRAWRPVQRP